MGLSAGTKLGPYEIVAPLGAGGMGEVYSARDTRLGRFVAVKVLPKEFSADTERLARFEQEARAVAALNHPNILAVFDIGDHDGTRYIVSELLEGETLRTRMDGGAVPVRRVQEYALQIAEGLAAAHDKGIVHRDLKPENVFVTKEGRAKILDFGLAKQSSVAAVASFGGATMTAGPQTTPGFMLGTVGYMSPEQVRGNPADHRSDIFSFGVVLHEMLSGERTFRRETSAETMTAILKEEPPEIVSTAARPISPALDRITRRCLEKDPDQRFQSARDLAFALEATSVSSSTAEARAIAAPRRVSLSLAAAIASAVLIVAAFVTVVILRTGTPPAPMFHQLTLSRGYVRIARFSPDGQTVVFGGAWNGDPMKLWFERADADSFSPLSVPDADLLAISSTGELAIALNRHHLGIHLPIGTLSRTSFSGGAPRDILEDVLDADWSPDGTALAVSRPVGDRFRLEYPIGKVLYETIGYISNVRISHHGDKIAFMDHPLYGDDRGYVSIVDLSGKRTVLTQEWSGEEGLAWSPDDREIWYSASDLASGNFHVLRAVTLGGKDRVVLRSPGNLTLQDIAADGRVLISTAAARHDITLGDVPTSKTTDLTWFDETWSESLSDDGQWIAFSTQESGANSNYSVYARKTDGTPAIRLGEGNVLGFSRDAKWVVANLPAADTSLALLPVGAGETRVLRSERVHFQSSFAFWTPDDKAILVAGGEQGHGERSYLQPIEGGEPRPVTPDGVHAVLLSPDGKRMLTTDRHGNFSVYPLTGGEAHQITMIANGDVPVQWLSDGRTILLRGNREEPIVSTYQLDLETGVRRPWKQFAPHDRVGLLENETFLVTPDARRYVIGETHHASTLFVVRGLK